MEVLRGCHLNVVGGLTVSGVHRVVATSGESARNLNKAVLNSATAARLLDVLDDSDWSSLARGGSTLAFYMGREAAGEIRRGLMQAGMPGEMPVLIACDVSGPSERRLVTRLDLLDLATKSFAAGAPTLILVGAAVMLAGGMPALPANASRACRQ